MTLYQTLGVESTATQEDIKRAYRKLASQHHPDKGGETATFQDVQVAYETLSDTDKRSKYDNMLVRQHNAQHGVTQQRGNTVGDFVRRWTSPLWDKNEDVHVRASIPLKKTLSYTIEPYSIRCRDGSVRDIMIRIPRGVTNGTRLVYRGFGDNSQKNIPPGDLYLTVAIIPHPQFTVSDIDLITEIKVDCLTAMTGGKCTVTDLEGNSYSVDIPPGIQHGTKLRLKDLGLYEPREHSTKRGNLIITVNVHVLTLTGDQLKLVEELKNTLQSTGNI